MFLVNKYSKFFDRSAIVKRILLLSSILLITSCGTSRGLNRESLKKELDEKTSIAESEINQAQSAKAKLPKPFKIAIFFQEPSKSEIERIEWSWSDLDKERIQKTVDTFKSSGEISGSFILKSNSTDVKALRKAAAKQGADTLLVISGVNDLDKYNTGLGWTYALVLPTLFVPATVSDIIFISRAMMWDVRYDFSYLMAESESMISRKYPAVFRTDKKQSIEAKEESIKGLQEELVKRISSLTQKK